MAPRLLDLFCGAGGASSGYVRAGFEVVGVDHRPQPNYPYQFIRADALTISLEGFDAVHASPPCQAFTIYRNKSGIGDSPDLVAATRAHLRASGLPYVIENVVGAPLIDPVLFCGSMFDETVELRRHRLFETNWDLEPPAWPCRHKLQTARRFPGGRSTDHGDSRHPVRATVEVGTWDIPLARQQEAMGIDWMSLQELSQAIPPTYTELIGRQLLRELHLPPCASPRSGFGDT